MKVILAIVVAGIITGIIAFITEVVVGVDAPNLLWFCIWFILSLCFSGIDGSDAVGLIDFDD